MTNLFLEGGWTTYPTALFGLLAVAAALVLAAKPERRFVPLVVSLSALTLTTGLLGTMAGLTGIAKAVANAADADVKGIVLACTTQALNSLLLACAFGVLVVLVVSSGALRVALGRSATAAP